MLTVEKKQAAESVDVPKCGSRGNAGALDDGLNVKNSRAHGPCAMGRRRAMLCASVRKSGRGRGNPLISNRRTIAGPRLMRGFSFGGSSNHGVIASAFLGALYPQFLTGSRAGGFRACRHLLRGISTPHGLPSPWKGRAVPNLATGISAMMRTLSRNVSTAFPSIPEPEYCPAESRHNRAYSVPKADTFTGIADCTEGLLQRAQAAYREACNHPAASVRRDLRARISEYVSDLIAFCREVEALPATATKGAASEGLLVCQRLRRCRYGLHAFRSCILCARCIDCRSRRRK